MPSSSPSIPDWDPWNCLIMSSPKTAASWSIRWSWKAKLTVVRRKALAGIAVPKLEDYLRECDSQTLDLVASFQRAMIEDLVGKTLIAARSCEARTLFVTGGVAANNELRLRFEKDAAQEGLQVYFPSRPLATDNAAMIAAAAYPKFLAKDFAAADFSAEAGMRLR